MRSKGALGSVPEAARRRYTGCLFGFHEQSSISCIIMSEIIFLSYQCRSNSNCWLSETEATIRIYFSTLRDRLKERVTSHAIYLRYVETHNERISMIANGGAWVCIARDSLYSQDRERSRAYRCERSSGAMAHWRVASGVLQGRPKVATARRNLYNRFWLHWSPVVVALIGAFINIH